METIKQLTECLKSITSLVVAGRIGDAIKQHGLHLVVYAMKYIATELAETLHKDNEPITFGASPERQEMFAACAALTSELNPNEPVAMQGPLTNAILIRVLQMLIANVSDEWVKEQMDWAVEFLRDVMKKIEAA